MKLRTWCILRNELMNTSALRRKLHISHKSFGKRPIKGPEYYESLPTFQYASNNTKYKTQMYTWGCTTTGALGNTHYLIPDKPSLYPITYLRKPGRLKFCNDHDITDVASGYGFTVYAVKPLNNDYQLFGTGLNTDCQIGFHCNELGKRLEVLLQPVPIELPLTYKATRIKQVTCGRSHTVVVTDAEGVFTLGNNSFGQCARKIIENENCSKQVIISKVRGIEGKVVKACCGQDHTLLLTEDGVIYACGLGCDGQTGLGHYNNVSDVQRLTGDLENRKVVDIASMADSNFAIDSEGNLFGWGNSEYQQFAMVTDQQQLNSPTHLPLPNVGKVIDATIGGTMCGVVSESGNVYVWGYGILGKGPNVILSTIPEEIPPTLFGSNDFNPNTKVMKIYAGLDCFAALTDSHELYTWGNNKNGKLGLGLKVNQNFPLRVNLASQVMKVSIGIDHMNVLCRSII